LHSDIDQKAPVFAASPEPIDGAPRGDADEAGLLVYHMAVWCEDSWRSKLDLKTILFPSHMPNPPDVEYAD
jgi:hypothetical protein